MTRHNGITRGQFAWSLFDWANQPYFTLILTFIFAPYFATQVIGDAVKGQAVWGYFLAAAGLLVAFSGPVFGAMADATGRRKPWCGAFSLLGVVGAMGLWLAEPGGSALLAGGMMILATVGFEIAIIFNNAFLPGLANPGREGWLSGFGWGLGYVGGLVALGLILYGIYLPEDPWFGLDKLKGEDARIVGPFTALWFCVFAVPFFLVTEDVPGKGVALGKGVRQGLATLWHTLSHLGRYKAIMWFLIARMIYADGLIALFSFGGIFAAGTFGWGTTQMGIFGMVIILFSAIGAFAGGRIDDHIGSRKTILLGLVGLVLAMLLVMSLGRDSVLFGTVATTPGTGNMQSLPEILMMVAAVLIGMCAGPVQAASRTMMMRLTPKDMSAEFFGLYAFSGKATAFLAPLTIGLATDMFGDQRVALVIVVLFLAVGGALFARRVT